MSDEERIKQTADFLRANAEEDTEQKEERHKRSSPPEESSQRSKRKKVGPAKRNKTEDADEELSKEESPDKKTKLGEQMKAREEKKHDQDMQIKDRFRPRANCILESDPSKGFNNSGAGQAGVSAAALTVKVATRNGAGISAGTPLLLNYGGSFDLSAVTGREASEFKGALDAIFDAQRGRLPVEADDNVAKAREEEEAAKARAAAEAKKKAEEELRMKRKLEEEAKQQEENAKRQKQEEDGSKLAAKTCVDDPRQNLDFVVIEMESPKASVGVRGDQVILASSEATNKKVPKNAVLVSWSKDAALVPWTIDVSCKADIVNTKEWIMNWKTEVLWMNDKKRYRLEKLIKEVCPNVGKIWMYAPFPAGTLPAVLVKKDPQKSFVFLSKAKEKDHIHKIVRLAQECTNISVLWVLGEKFGRLEPVGLALVTNKQIYLPAKWELIL